MQDPIFSTILRKKEQQVKGIAIKFDGTDKQRKYICSVLDISYYSVKYLKVNDYICYVPEFKSTFILNEETFNKFYEINGTIVDIQVDD